MLHYSFMLFNEQNGTRPIKDLHEIMQQNLSKTNPVHTAKAKAFDLANAIPNSLVSQSRKVDFIKGVLSAAETKKHVSVIGDAAAQERVSYDIGN